MEILSVMEILKFPDPVLRKRAKEIEVVDDRVRELAEKMIKTLHAAPGVGLAAPQVGVSERLIVVDVSAGEDPDEIIVIVNPEFTYREGETGIEEGCLSVPDFTEMVPRSERVVVKGLDLEGRSITVEGEDLFAIVLQHEMDHLDGVLFFDHISKLKRSRYIAKRKKQLREESNKQGSA